MSTEEGHHIAADDEPTRDPHPEPGDVTDADTEFAISNDERPDLPLDAKASHSAGSPTDELYDAAPTDNPNDEVREEVAMLDNDSHKWSR